MIYEIAMGKDVFLMQFHQKVALMTPNISLKSTKMNNHLLKQAYKHITPCN